MTAALNQDAVKLDQHRRAVRANPRDARAHAMLGIVLQQAGQLSDAVASYRRALELDPRTPGMQGVLALALLELGKPDEAVEAFRKAIKEQPHDAELQRALAEAQRQLETEAAVQGARRAVELDPDNVDVHLALASVLYVAGRQREAEEALRNVVRLAPDNTDALFDLGNTLINQREHGKAAPIYRQVLERCPDHIGALVNLAACLIELHDLNGAEHYYRRVLKLDPERIAVMRDLGFVLNSLGRLDEGRVILERAVELAPEDPVSRSFLALNRFDAGLWDEALVHTRSVLADPHTLPTTQSGMLFVLSHCCNDPAELIAAHRDFGRRCEAPFAGNIKAHANDRNPSRVLKVGFVSPDLGYHAVANFVSPVLELLKQSTQLELHAYHTNTIADNATGQLRSHFKQWHEVANLDDDALEQKIRADQMDILVDLSGHSARNRLALFARKPAPIQASWIGYAGTTGLAAMDYYIADQFQVPPGRYDDQFTEKLVWLPLSAPFLPNPSSPPINPLPALTNGYLTFGSFHRPNKLGRHVIAQWSKLLRALPDSKLLLGALSAGNDYELVNWFADEGIDKSRLLLRPRSTMGVYLKHHHEVDVCLSPFPYTGGTTVCHALWMGVPSLATIGPTVASHGTACYLAHLGLSSFIADDEQSYVRLATFLSENLETLGQLRATMRERFTNSVLGYPGVTAAGLEFAFRKMWHRWCDGLPAEPMRVHLSDLSE